MKAEPCPDCGNALQFRAVDARATIFQATCCGRTTEHIFVRVSRPRHKYPAVGDAGTAHLAAAGRVRIDWQYEGSMWLATGREDP